MLAIMSTFELMDEAHELGHFILHSEPYVTYVQTKKGLDQDIESQVLIRQFTNMKDQFEEVQRFGKYHPDYKKVSTDIRQIKRQVDSSPTVISFKKAELELESLLNEISELIARAVSDTIKVPTGNPFFDNMSCSGGCATGGGCSC